MDKNETNENKKDRVQKKQKTKLFGSVKLLRAVVSVIVLLFVIAAAYIAIKCEGDLSWNNIERTVKNLRADVRSVESFDFGSSEKAVFASVGSGLLKADGSRVTLYSAAGAELYDEKQRLARPTMHQNAGRAVVYGTGDTYAAVFDGSGLLYDVTTEKEIISASLSAEGKLAVCTLEDGWNGSVTVYDAKGRAVYQWYCGSGYPTITAVSRDGGKMAVITYGSEGSSVVLLRLDREEEQARCLLGETMALDMRFLGSGTIMLLTENGALTLNTAGEETGSYSFEGKRLVSYAMGSDEMLLAVLEEFPGDTPELVSIGASCRELGRTEAKGTLLAVSTAGAHAAALYDGEAVLYKKDLTAELSLILTKKDASNILMRKDGTALILGAYTAEKLEP